MNVHVTAEVSPEASIGEGTEIWHHAQVRERARIGKGCVLGKGVYVDAEVVVGDNCKLQNGVSLFRPARLEDGVFVGPGAVLTNDRLPRAIHPDGRPKQARDWAPLGVVVRHGAAIGASSVVLPGVAVGRWAMVGAGAAVTRDVPDHALVAGNPARLIGYVCACGARLDVSAGADDWMCTECIGVAPKRP